MELTLEECQLIGTALNALPTSIAAADRQRFAMSCIIVDKLDAYATKLQEDAKKNARNVQADKPKGKGAKGAK